jgi:hypothetical protein
MVTVVSPQQEALGGVYQGALGAGLRVPLPHRRPDLNEDVCLVGGIGDGLVVDMERQGKGVSRSSQGVDVGATATQQIFTIL